MPTDSWITLLVLIAAPLCSTTINAECELLEMRKIVMGSCDKFSRKIRSYGDIDFYDHLRSLEGNQTTSNGDRYRRELKAHHHHIATDGDHHHQHHNHQRYYLKTAFPYETQEGYIEVAYNRKMYKWLRHMKDIANVDDFSRDIFSEPGNGRQMEKHQQDYHTYRTASRAEKESNNNEVYKHPVRSHEETSTKTERKGRKRREGHVMRNRRESDPHAMVTYCCKHPLSDMCQYHFCYA